MKKMYDKIQHFAVGFCLSLTGIVFFPLILTGFIFGIGKELYDYISGRGVSDWQDLVATLWGDDNKGIKIGSKVSITNGYTNTFKDVISLTKGKFGQLEVVE